MMRAKLYEATEANVIGTEYVRIGLLDPADAGRVQDLLKKYLAQRVLFYSVRDARQLPEVNAHTSKCSSSCGRWSRARQRQTRLP